MRTRIATLAILLTLVVGFTPGLAFAVEDGGDLAAGSTALTAQSATNYDLWVGGVRVTSANASSVKGSGVSGKVSYDAATSTLSLEDATITGSYSIVEGGSFPSAYRYGIYCPNGTLNVKLTGTNVVEVSETTSLDSGFEDVCGIRAPKLQFTGAGTLSVTSEVEHSSAAVGRSSYGIWVFGGMTVASGATVNVASSTTGQDRSCGVQADNLTVQGQLSASAHSGSGRAWAVYVTYKKGLTVAKGGKLTATVDHGSDMLAIYVQESTETFTVNGSVKAKAASFDGSDESARGVSCGNIAIGAVGTFEAFGDGGALSDGASIKLATTKSRVSAGSSASSAKATTAAKIGSQRFVRVLAPKPVAKKANTLTVKAKTVTFKASKVKTKARSVKAGKAFTVKKAKGKVTYKVTKYVTKAAKGKVKVASSGKVTVKKGTPKKTYKLKVRVKAAGNSTYKAGSKTVTLVVKVK